MKTTIKVMMGLAVICLIGVLMFGVKKGIEELRRIKDAKPHPRDFRLLDVAGVSNSATFILPEGGDYDFVLGLPRGSAANCPDGKISLFAKGKEMYSKKFAIKDLTECNWLNSSNLQGYVITWSSNTNQLDAILSSHGEYTIRMEFDRKTDLEVSLWLTLLQTWKQRMEFTNETILKN